MADYHNNVRFIEYDGYVVAIIRRLRQLPRDFYCFGNLYRELGFDVIADEKGGQVNPRMILATPDTVFSMFLKMRENYSFVNLKKDKSGEYNVSLYRKRRKNLTFNDNFILSMDYLNYAPSLNDTLPNGVIVFKYKEDIVVDIDDIWKRVL